MKQATSKKRILQIAVSLVGFSATGISCIVVAVLIWFFSTDIASSEIAFLLGIGSSIVGLIIGYRLDASAAVQKRFQAKRVNFKWCIISPLVVAVFLAGLLVFAALVAFDITFDMEDLLQRDLVFFLAGGLISALPLVLLYFSIKNAKRAERIQLPKLTAFAAISTAVLVLLSFGLGFVRDTYIEGSITNGTGHDDGPWLTWSADPTNSICIAWLTSRENSSTVHYGTNPANLNLTAFDPRLVHIHAIHLADLDPATTYYYRIPEAFETNHASTLFHFMTAPTTSRAYKFGVFGDMQPPSETSEILQTNAMVIDGLISRDLDFVLQLGDIANSGTDVADWHLAFSSLARLGANTPIMAAIGNHDWSGISGSANWGKLFSYPYAGTGAAKYYSFDYLNSHFVVIDNFEQAYHMTDAQVRWIEDDIETARTRGQKWIFCTFHLSMMSTATNGMNQELQRQLVPVFDKLAVDAVFYAHDHDYEHYNYTYGHDGLVYEPEHDWEHHPVQYFCSGTGGADLEVGYGVLGQSIETDMVTWWNVSAGAYQEQSYTRRPWNASRYVTHGFPVNYTQRDPSGIHDGKYYYHYPPYQAYHDEVFQLGYEYGEQAYHFIEITIAENTCNITAMYPNGVTMQGPGSSASQTWQFVKP
nr:metallophosphoesterase family protein [Candidatus Sigynarchaeota archaeon]